MATATDEPKADEKPKRKLETLLPGDQVWFWMQPTPAKPIQPFPAEVIEQSRVRPDTYELNVFLRGVMLGKTGVPFAAAPQQGVITKRDPKLLK